MSSHLSMIRKDASVQSISPARGGTPIQATGPVPSWVMNPPIDCAWAERSDSVEGWRLGAVCVLFLIPFNYAY